MPLVISQNSQKSTCATVSFLIKLQPQACNFIKKRLWQRCFPVNFAKFLRAPFLQITSGWLLLALDVIKIQKNSFCFKDLLSYLAAKFFIIKPLRWDGCFAVTLAQWESIPKPSVPCPVLLSNNCVIIKACVRNITGRTNLAYSKKST